MSIKKTTNNKSIPIDEKVNDDIVVLNKEESKGEKPKEEKDNFIINGSFSILIKENSVKRYLKKLLCYQVPQLRNMLIILRKKAYKYQLTDAKAKEVYNLLSNNEIMRNVICNMNGVKNKEKTDLVKKYFEKDTMFIEIQKFAKNLDRKVVHSILKELNKNYKESFKRIKEYNENKSAYFKKYKVKGEPKLPFPKKIKQINNVSIEVDSCLWSFKTIKDKEKKPHRVIGVKLGNKRLYVPMNDFAFPIKKNKALRSLNISHRNDCFYFNFTYGNKESVIKKENEVQKTLNKDKKKLPQKIAGMDLGLKYLFTLFVDDKQLPSICQSNNKMKAKNVSFNNQISKLNQSISQEVIKYKTLKNGVKIAVKWTKRGEDLKHFKRFLFEKRNRYFKDNYEKASTHLINYLLKNNITDLVVSKNLGFLKNKDKNEKHKLNKKVQSHFYQLPLISFIHMIERKLKGKIKVHFINESYTSKTSSLSKEINEIKQLSQKEKLSTNDCGGSRVKRGLFLDYKYKLKIHSDVNGAINHIKVKFKKDFSWLINYKKKICNPIVLHNSEDLANIV